MSMIHKLTTGLACKALLLGVVFAASEALAETPETTATLTNLSNTGNRLVAPCQKNKMGAAQGWSPADNVQNTCEQIVDKHLSKELGRKEKLQRLKAKIEKLQQILQAFKQASQKAPESDVAAITAQAKAAEDAFATYTTESATELRANAKQLAEQNQAFKEYTNKLAQDPNNTNDNQMLNDAAKYSADIDKAVDQFNARAAAVEAEAAQTRMNAAQLNSQSLSAKDLAGALGATGSSPSQGNKGSTISSGAPRIGGGEVSATGASLSNQARLFPTGVAGENSVMPSGYENAANNSAAETKAEKELTAKEKIQKALEEKLAKGRSGAKSSDIAGGDAATGATPDKNTQDALTPTATGSTTADTAMSTAGGVPDFGLGVALGSDDTNFSDLLNNMLGLGENPEAELSSVAEGRELASLTDAGGVSGRLPDGVLSEDSGTLFERVKQTSLRLRKSGKVLDGLNSKI